MSKLLHILTIIATMHGFAHCPQEVLSESPNQDYDRTGNLDISDLKPLCARKPEAVICSGHRGGQLTFKEVEKVDAEYRAVFQYRSDVASWGSYRWDNWSACGECTEYALTLSELLAMDGEDGRDMSLVLIDQCDTGGCDGHARLWVRTRDHGLVEVDNQHAPEHPHFEEGEYQVYMTMDGKRIFRPFPGWAVGKNETEWIGQ